MTAVAADVAEVLAGRARWCVMGGDSAEVLPSLPASSAHAVVTDPPSGIAFMGLAWDRDHGGRAAWVAKMAHVLGLARAATVPGGRSFVWALPRTTHWTGCAVEDGGWSIETVVTHLFATGWPKGASQLKPSSEHWYLSRTGPSTALEIDACRVGSTKDVPASPSLRPWHGRMAPSSTDESGFDPNVGRWPPNTLLSHAPGCVCEGVRTSRRNVETGARHDSALVNAYGDGVNGRSTTSVTETVDAWVCVEGCPARDLAKQSGEHPGMKPARLLRGSTTGAGVGYGSNEPHDAGVIGRGDTGTAARFFPQFEADDPDAPFNAPLFRYEAKPSRAEKSAGVDLDARPADAYAAHRGRRMEGEAVRFDGEAATRASNNHPTVKPVALMRWLIRLITKPGDVVLDPFGGSGTTAVAALLEGRRVILIEREARYVEIARARCEHAQPSRERLRTMTTSPLAAPAAADFGPLFGGTP